MSSALTVPRMRLATLNTWGTRGDWTRRRPVLRDGLAGLDADLVTLQETIVTSDHDQVAEVLPDAYQLVHSRAREDDGQGITTASRWPVGETIELDLNVTPRTGEFACTSLITEVLAPAPLGRIWLVNHFPDYQLDHEHERELQAVRAARALEDLLAGRPGHVIVAGDLDADPDATSIRFWTGRHALDGISACYRDAWESARPGDPGPTYVPDNPYSGDWDWPFRRIDYILIRCARHGGPSLRVTRCDRTFDTPATTVSDHYGLVADLAVAAEPAGTGP
jgi:endonuclease/exonuclease/phosphatase family metal-dependent hydrolase